MSIMGECVFAAVVVVSVGVIAAYTPPAEDSCEVVGSELPEFHCQDEAVRIGFPFLENAVQYRRLLVDNSTTFHVSYSEQRDLRALGHRVTQEGRVLYLLPSVPSDSGTYTYVFRSNVFCFTGNISVTIYETGREDMDMMSHPVTEWLDSDLTIRCPHTKHFQRVETPHWYKGFHAEASLLNGARYERSGENDFIIKNISAADEGLYTCRLRVIFNNKLFNISRTLKLHVLVPDTHTGVTDEVSQHSMSTAPSISPPLIITPLNRSVIKCQFGSSLVIQCKVTADSQSAARTEVTWLVNSQSLESSYVRGRAFQTARSEHDGHVAVQLIILEVHKEDIGAELKCVTQNAAGKQEVITQIEVEDDVLMWVTVGIVASCFFLLVLSVFLYQLRPRAQKRTHYVLTRQSSSFS